MFKKTWSCSPPCWDPSPALVTETWSPELAQSRDPAACKVLLARRLCLHCESVWPDSPLGFPTSLSAASRALFLRSLSGWRVYWFYSGLSECHLERLCCHSSPPVSPQSSVSFSCFSLFHFSVCFLSPALECEPQHSRNLSSHATPWSGWSSLWTCLPGKPITGSICLEAIRWLISKCVNSQLSHPWCSEWSNCMRENTCWRSMLSLSC